MGSRTKARNQRKALARRRSHHRAESHELTPSQAEAREVAPPARMPGQRSWGRNASHEFLNHVALRSRAWSGIPMPVEGFRFVLEPDYPNRDAIQGVLDRVDPVDPLERLSALRRTERGFTCHADDVGALLIRNTWWAAARNAQVYLYETEAEPGRVKMLLDRAARAPGRRWSLLMSTIGASTGWDPRAEERAMGKLEGLLRPHLMDMYRATGCFIETSKRSGVSYIVRRCRPTLVLVPWDRTHPDAEDLPMRCLGALCMHPVGYYRDTFAGGMVPTDDVIAHLLMIRGDEHMFWRKARLHDVWEPEAGL